MVAAKNHDNETGDACLLVSCAQRIHALFQCLDERRYEALIAYFAEDGRWLRQGKWLKGRPSILQALQERPATQATCHVMTNAYISDRSVDTVTVKNYMTAYRHDHAGDGAVPVVSAPFRINQIETVFSLKRPGLVILEQQMVPRFNFAAASTAGAHSVL